LSSLLSWLADWDGYYSKEGRLITYIYPLLLQYTKPKTKSFS
jgi:hypothetical protein